MALFVQKGGNFFGEINFSQANICNLLCCILIVSLPFHSIWAGIWIPVKIGKSDFSLIKLNNNYQKIKYFI